MWTFSKHHTFKYDFWEKTQYSNMNFWCFLVTPEKQCEQGAQVFFPLCGYRNFCSREKNRIFGQIWPKICILGHYGPNIGLSHPFCPLPDQINNANKVLQWFSDMCEPNLLLPHKIIRMFELKTAIFLGHKQALPAHLVPCRLVVVEGGLYLARHLFTSCSCVGHRCASQVGWST